MDILTLTAMCPHAWTPSVNNDRYKADEYQEVVRFVDWLSNHRMMLTDGVSPSIKLAEVASPSCRVRGIMHRLSTEIARCELPQDKTS